MAGIVDAINSIVNKIKDQTDKGLPKAKKSQGKSNSGESKQNASIVNSKPNELKQADEKAHQEQTARIQNVFDNVQNMGLDLGPVTAENLNSFNQESSDATKKAYEDYFASAKDRDSKHDSVGVWNIQYTDMDDNGRIGGAERVDNGSSIEENRTSPYITMNELQRQTDAGFGNEDTQNRINELKDMGYNGDAILSKQELRDYGYVPYVKDGASNMTNHIDDAARASERFWNDVGRARQENTDWTVDVNGEQVSGKELDDIILDYFDKAYSDEEQNKLDNNKGSQYWDYVVAGENVGASDEVVLSIDDFDGENLYIAVNGEERKVPVSNPNGYTLEDVADDSDKLHELTDQVLTLQPASIAVGNNLIPFNDLPAYTKNPTVLEMLLKATMGDSIENGEEALNTIQRQAGSRADYTAKLPIVGDVLPVGIPNGAMPSYAYSENAIDTLLNDPLTLATAQLPDAALSSAAYFLPKMVGTIERGVSQAYLNNLGISTMGGGEDGVYQAVDDVATAPLATTGGSILESALGGAVGGRGNGTGVFEKLLQKGGAKIAGHTIASPLYNDVFVPTISEGIEEVATGPVWDMVTQNPTDFYANPVLDEQGFETNEYENMPWNERFWNFLPRAGSDMLIGSAIGFAPSAANLPGAIYQHIDPNSYYNAIKGGEYRIPTNPEYNLMLAKYLINKKEGE